VGSGIGGALVIHDELYTGGGGVASEIGHLRPGIDAESAEATVESASCGWAIAAAAREQLAAVEGDPPSSAAADLLHRCGGDPKQLTARDVADALAEGNRIAIRVFEAAIRTYGWALAQAVTLLAPDVLVIGGGVPKVGESLFFQPLRKEVAKYVFPPLSDAYEIVPAALGEEVVPYGALALAASAAP
jgi:glucokinase